MICFIIAIGFTIRMPSIAGLVPSGLGDAEVVGGRIGRVGVGARGQAGPDLVSARGAWVWRGALSGTAVLRNAAWHFRCYSKRESNRQFNRQFIRQFN